MHALTYNWHLINCSIENAWWNPKSPSNMQSKLFNLFKTTQSYIHVTILLQQGNLLLPVNLIQVSLLQIKLPLHIGEK